MAPLAHIATTDTGGGTGRVAFLRTDALGSVRATVNTWGEERVWFGDDIHGYPTWTAGDSKATKFGYASGYTDPTGSDGCDWVYDADSAWCWEDLGYHAVGAVPFIGVAAARRKPATATLRRTPVFATPDHLDGRAFWLSHAFPSVPGFVPKPTGVLAANIGAGHLAGGTQ